MRRLADDPSPRYSSQKLTRVRSGGFVALALQVTFWEELKYEARLAAVQHVVGP
jgi:hypothetical protein